MVELTEEQDDIGVTRWSVIMSDPATNRETGLRIYHGEDELHARSVHACVAALEAENERLREAMKVTEADRNAARESLAQELRSVLGERGLWTPKGRASDLILAFSKAIDDLHAKLEAAESMDDFLCEAKEQLSFVQIEGLGIEHLSHLEKASAMLRETLK